MLVYDENREVNELEEEVLEYAGAQPEYNLPCPLCRHYELCDLWKDGRKVCNSFSSKN